MQAYYNNYDLLTPNMLKSELELYFDNVNVKLIYYYIIDKNINKLFKKFFVLMTVNEFNGSKYLYEALNNIQKIYLDHFRKEKKIIATLIIKKFLRDRIIDRLYRYPDGIMLKSLKKSFLNNQNK